MYTRTFDNLHLACLTPEWHAKTCGYWYTVTTHSTPLTAFRTRAALEAWLDRMDLALDGDLPEHGTHALRNIAGAFRRSSHMSPETFDAIEGRRVLCLDNGRYTLGKITYDADGARTLHHLNCNAPRQEFDHALARRAEDEGSDMPSIESAP